MLKIKQLDEQKLFNNGFKKSNQDYIRKHVVYSYKGKNRIYPVISLVAIIHVESREITIDVVEQDGKRYMSFYFMEFSRNNSLVSFLKDKYDQEIDFLAKENICYSPSNKK